jgi:hypothetical protein
MEGIEYHGPAAIAIGDIVYHHLRLKTGKEERA